MMTTMTMMMTTTTMLITPTTTLCTSHPWRSLNPCSSREIPPMTATVRTPRLLPNLIASSSICCASSLVGARIMAYGPNSASSNLHHHSNRFQIFTNLILTNLNIMDMQQNRIHKAMCFPNSQQSTTTVTTTTITTTKKVHAYREFIFQFINSRLQTLNFCSVRVL